MEQSSIKRQKATTAFEHHEKDAWDKKYIEDHFIESDQLQLVKLIKSGDFNAKEALIIKNIHLVENIAGEFQNKGLTNLDLILKGSMGLINAAENFNPLEGINFSAYITNSVEQSIKQAIVENMNKTPIPLNNIGLITLKNKRKNSMVFG